MIYEQLLREDQDAAIEQELKLAANALAAELKDELQDQQQVEEAVDPISILGYLLALSSMINLIAKLAKKLFKKYKLPNAAKAAYDIEHWTHKFEESFKKPIELVVKLFVKDQAAVKKITHALFILLLLFYAFQAGEQLYKAFAQTETAKAGISSLKLALKGKDITNLIKAGAPITQIDDLADAV